MPARSADAVDASVQRARARRVPASRRDAASAQPRPSRPRRAGAARSRAPRADPGFLRALGLRSRSPTDPLSAASSAAAGREVTRRRRANETRGRVDIRSALPARESAPLRTFAAGRLLPRRRRGMIGRWGRRRASRDPGARRPGRAARRRYTLGEPGEERTVELARVLIGRYPVCNAHMGKRDEQLADHPATDVTRDEAEAFCLRDGARLPTADEWEALARGADARAYPWGETFDETRCNCAEALWGWTVPVTAHPHRRLPARRRAARRQRLGVGRRPHARRLGRRQGRLVPRHRLGPARLSHPGGRPRPRHAHHRLPHRRRPREDCMTDRPRRRDGRAQGGLRPLLR